MSSLTAQQAIEAARAVAATLAKDAVERDRANAKPHAEVQLLRDAALPAILLPREVGGSGLGWDTALRVVREISAADGSIGQLLGYHYMNQDLLVWLHNPDALALWGVRSAEHQWVWGDAVDVYAPATTLVGDGSGFRMSGRKSFATGFSVADVSVVAVAEPGTGSPLLVIVESTADGVAPGGDWDNLGQRLSASGSVTFTDVAISPEQVLGTLDPARATPQGSLIAPVSQAVHSEMYLGIAQGALRTAGEYTRTVSRPFLLSGVESATADPYVLATYGRLVAAVRAVEALADDVGTHVARVNAARDGLTWDARGELAVHTSALKVVAIETVLEVTSRIFEVTGARATSNAVGLDRFWRNARTHTLHDPVVYKQREVGEHFLTGTYPPFTVYS
ncbi:monooxygenase [Pseudonocardia yunnanensis]|uniref:Acyl-CoA dehydrogenase family protein n=1 Tax=Pseudonocardia yunnanensis TaxID=58107 RepID=A0ABW4F476_9PSEU